VEIVPTDQQAFVHRALRWLALVGLASGILHVITLVVFGVFQGFQYDRWLIGGPVSRAMTTILSCMRVADVLLLVIGSAGLLRWKHWSRTTLMIWAILRMLLTGGTSLGYLMTVFGRTTATTQPIGDNAFLTLWAMFANTVQEWVLPVMFLWIFRQREVQRLWAKPQSGGFDVIPMATPTGAAAYDDTST
jgi:hypothetical protein